MKEDFDQVYMKDRREWRDWLKKNHSKFNGIWLVYYKKHTGSESISYNDAVEEALCYGWIDSKVNKIDEKRYRQIFTPRNDKSNWSALNKKRVEKLIKSKKMTKFGLRKIEAAKQNGMWFKDDPVKIEFEVPQEFQRELNKHKEANDFFSELTSSHKKEYIRWIASAKKEETRMRRSKEAISLLLEKKKLGLK